MKLLKVTYEHRAYTEDEAKDAILKFRNEAKDNGDLVQSAGYTYKSKKKKGEVVAEAWVVKCVAVYDEVWDEGEGA
jgi:lysyl-tRNA synthetase class II